jgi:hypothetical protein
MHFRIDRTGAGLEPCQKYAGSRSRTKLARVALLAALLASIVSSWGHTAHAETDAQRATARTLATQGFKAISEQRWADAVDLFDRAESLVHAPAHVLYLGRAYTRMGKLVAAHEAYVKLTRETLASNAPRAAVRAQQDGTKELSELEARLPTIDISTLPAAPAVTVKIDGAAIPRAMIGTAVPIDPGTHTVGAAADGFTPAERTVDIAEGTHGSVVLELKPLPVRENAVVATGMHPTPLHDTLPADTLEQPVTPDRGSNTLRVLGYVGLGVAALSAGAGVLFAVESHDNRSQGDRLCPMNVCQAANKSQLDSLDKKATLFGQLSITALVVAGVSAASGITALALSPGKPSATTPTATLWLGPGVTGMRGTF